MVTSGLQYPVARVALPQARWNGARDTEYSHTGSEVARRGDRSWRSTGAR